MVVGLRVNVTVPKAVTSGSNATIVCDHDLDSDNVYTVKWYKGGHEFFRYTPREFPALKLFWLPGIKVDVSIKWMNGMLRGCKQILFSSFATQ